MRCDGRPDVMGWMRWDGMGWDGLGCDGMAWAGMAWVSRAGFLCVVAVEITFQPVRGVDEEVVVSFVVRAAVIVIDRFL